MADYNSEGSLKWRFDYADGRMPVSGMFEGETFYFAYDQVGSLRAVIDAEGSVVKTIRYDSFGNIIEDTNPDLTVPFGFASGLHDRDTGLVRFGFRDYDPDTGRWTAKDPIGFRGGSVGLYSYCRMNVINRIDSDGLQSWHFDPDPNNPGERFIHHGKYRFNKNGDLVDHSGKVVDPKPCKGQSRRGMRAALQWLMNKKPDFFKLGPAVFVFDFQKDMIENMNQGREPDDMGYN